MTKRFLFTFSVIALLGLSLSAIISGYKQPACAQRATAAEVSADTTLLRESGENPAVQYTLQYAIDKLNSTDRLERLRALSVLTSSYDAVSRQIVQELEQQKGNLDHTYNGKTYTIVVAAGIYRVADAVPLLIDNITYEIDKSTIPHGAKFSPWVYYPIANALVEIGDGTVIQSVIKQLSTATDEKTITFDALVLDRILGHAMATILLTAARATAPTDKEQARYDSAITLIQKGVHLSNMGMITLEE